MQNQLHQTLLDMGVAHDVLVPAGSGYFHADMVLHDHFTGGRKVAVMANQWRRFTSNEPYRPMGSTTLRNELMAYWGWTLVEVPIYEWEKMSFEERAPYLT